jgi:hypothetical protein
LFSELYLFPDERTFEHQRPLPIELSLWRGALHHRLEV